MADNRDSVLTLDELSAYLKVSKSTLYKLAQDGKVPGQKVGRHWRFRKTAIDKWLDERHVQSGGGKAEKAGIRRCGSGGERSSTQTGG